jgi:hypothetical protein
MCAHSSARARIRSKSGKANERVQRRSHGRRSECIAELDHVPVRYIGDHDAVVHSPVERTIHLLAAVHARPPRMDPQSSSPSSSSPLDAVGAGNN